MTKELENKLLAFFAANATEFDIKPFQKSDCGYTVVDGKMTNNFYNRRTNTDVDAKLDFARNMLEKYKEFCNLLYDDSTSEVLSK